jgi:MarR family multiple antibiotic resistance transcriptional regulator
MKTPLTHRDKLIQTLFENMDTTKRGMYAQLNALNRTLPIPRSQLELLMAIRHTQPVSFKDLAKQLYLTPGAISQLAEGLEQQNMIERQVAPGDRRIQCLVTTSKGDKLLQDVEKKRRTILEAVLQELTDDELEVWLKIQKKLIKQFQAEIANQTKKENQS